MSHIVVVPGTITSKLITTSELCRRLRQEGHAVSYLVPPSKAASDQDIACIAEDLKAEAACGTDTAEATAFQGRVRALEPDLVLIDIEAHEHIVAALAGRLSVALLSVFFNLWKRPGVPPLHQDITPGQGLAGTRCGIAAGWLAFNAQQCRALLKSRLRKKGYIAVLHGYARRLGFDLSSHVDHFQALLPFVYRGLPVLTLNLEELEFPGGVHATSHYVGPMPNAERRALSLTGEERRARRELSELSAVREDRKLIYCAFGSYFHGDDRAFWRKAMAAIGERPDWIGVLGLGGRLDPASLGPMPENVRAYRWAPQMDALALADCAVVHGGMTTVYECIENDVPMVVYPYAEIFDQFGTANRVKLHGLGVVGDRRRDTPHRIAERIDQVLGNLEIKAKVEDMRGHISRYEEERRLARALETIIAANEQPPG